jgi:hypothetical protein
MKKHYLLILLLLPLICLSQTTVYHETFGTSATNPYTGSPSTATVPIGLAAYNVSTATGIISTVLNATDAQLQISGLTASAVNGREYMTVPISSLTGLNSQLNLNTGPVTWTFNMKTTRTTVMSSASDANYGIGRYYACVVLASTGFNLVSGTNGYAVIFQRSTADSTKNSVRLSKFTNGLSAGSSAAIPGTSVYSKLAESPAFTSLTNSISVKVVYTPSTDKWELFYREDPSTTFVDPTTGTALTSAGAAVTDNTYTGTTMTHIGYLGSHANSANPVNSFQYDNYKITVTPVVTTNYYFDGSGSLNDVTNWCTNTDGTGTNPPNFTTDDQFFNIRTTLTTDAAWVVSGSGTKIIVGDATLAPVTVTIALGFPITGTIEVKAASSGSNIILVKDNIFPSFGNSNANSEVHFQTKGTVTGGTFGKVFVDGGVITDTVTFAGAPNTILTSLLVTLNSFMVGSSTTANFINASGAAVTINGYFRTSRPGGLTTANTTPAGLTANGVIQFSGADNIILGSASTIEYARGTSTTVQTINPRSDYFNLTIVGDANNKTIAAPTTVAGTLTLNITGTSTLTGMSNVTFANNASIFRTNGAFDAAPIFGASVNLTYNGTTAVTSGYELPTSLKVLVINNAAGVTLNSSLTLTDSLKLSSGKLTIPAAQSLRITSGFDVLGAPFSNAKYIVSVLSGANTGKLRIDNITTAKLFPIGTASNYLPVTVTPSSAMDYEVSVFTGATADGLPTGTALTAAQKDRLVDAVWTINRMNGTGNCDVQTNWESTLEGVAFAAFANSSIGIARHNGTSWDAFIGSGDNTANTATATFSSFSPFLVGELATVLPVTLKSVSATVRPVGIDINWKVENESSMLKYEIEKSKNGFDFTSIGMVDATNKSNYNFTDASVLTGVFYYRIKMININGSYKYSYVISVKQSINSDITIYPNPVANTLLINGLKNNNSIKIVNSAGQIVLQQNANTNSLSMDVSSFKPGIYAIQIASENKKIISKTFIKE